MLGLDALDVAIGLVFVYLMVSFVCSAGVELVEMLMKQRGKHLYQGIVSLLKSDGAKELYKHPLVQSLSTGTSLPSYIPPRNFALALLNGIGSGSAATNAAAIKDAIDGLDKNSDLYKTLSAIYLGANGEAESIIKGIEDWYNSAMDRVSGWYKRYTQWWLLGFGLVAAMAINVDTIYIVKQLSNNKAMRDAIVATAGQGIKAPTQGTSVAEAQANLDASIAKLKSAGLPVGWDDTPSNGSCWQHIIGWLLTAIAVSFGAPFWFDVLNKFMVVRSTVKPKEKSGPEKSKDAQ